MKSSNEVIEAIKGFEGLRLTAYKCPAGVWTIGYGHTSRVREGQTISEAEAELMLRADLNVFETFVNAFHENITQSQFDALVCLIYNIGIGSYQSSTLKRKIDEGAPLEEIGQQWQRWVHSNGKVLTALKKRRKWEFELFCKNLL